MLLLAVANDSGMMWRAWPSIAQFDVLGSPGGVFSTLRMRAELDLHQIKQVEQVTTSFCPVLAQDSEQSG
jgi:hypothetical protein